MVTFVSRYLIALGTGGIKPFVSSFGADQFDETDVRERKKKSSFFNWFYLSINIGALFGSSILVWIQMNVGWGWGFGVHLSINIGALFGSSILVWIQMNVGWGWGFGVPIVSMALAVAFFFSGSPLYHVQKPSGSPLVRLGQVIISSFRKYNIKVPNDKSLLYETSDDTESQIVGSRKLEHTDKLRFLDKAAGETDSDQRKNP